MPSSPPDGEAVPPHGRLPAGAVAEFSCGSGTDPLADSPAAPFGAYVHVPFCVRRCGYCDFNTYTPGELGAGSFAPARPSVVSDYLDALAAEIDLAARVLPVRPLGTVFLGGGTPSLLAPAEVGAVLTHLARVFGFLPDAEVTIEANPDTIDADALTALAEAGVTRVSLGMQSAVGDVLRTLDRTHDPAAVPAAIDAARAVGLVTSVDLIYGAPGESLTNWRTSLEAAIAMRPDHVSAYALVVEEGTRLAARVRRGEVAAPRDDDEADKYELADELLTAAGYHWYEVSNWSATDAGICRHNLQYWTGGHWWGFGPGAHSHIGGVRWWNVRHPRAYAHRLVSGLSPGEGREILTPQDRYTEDVLLRIRLASGIERARLRDDALGVIPELLSDNLIRMLGDRIVLTRRGRLLADTVVHRLLC